MNDGIKLGKLTEKQAAEAYEELRAMTANFIPYIERFQQDNPSATDERVVSILIESFRHYCATSFSLDPKEIGKMVLSGESEELMMQFALLATDKKRMSIFLGALIRLAIPPFCDMGEFKDDFKIVSKDPRAQQADHN